MAMTIGNRTYAGVDVTSNADGTRVGMTVPMSPTMTYGDVRAIVDEIARISRGTMRLRVINAPDYDIPDLYDDDGRRKQRYQPPIPMTNQSGARQYTVYDTLGFWNPYDARQFDAHEGFTPYVSTVCERGDDGRIVYDADELRYNDVFDRAAFDTLIPDFGAGDDIGVYILEESNSGVCVPLTEDSCVLWKFDDDGWNIVNRLTVISGDVMRRERWQHALVNGDAYVHDLGGDDTAHRARYRDMCLDAELARDENLLARALRGEDVSDELDALARRTTPLVEPK